MATHPSPTQLRDVLMILLAQASGSTFSYWDCRLGLLERDMPRHGRHNWRLTAHSGSATDEADIARTVEFLRAEHPLADWGDVREVFAPMLVSAGRI